MPVNCYELERLREAIRPLRLHWFPRLGSTNDQAVLMRQRHKLFAPAVVLAGAQVAGRGRNSNPWWSNNGCITMTLVFPAHESVALHQLPLIAGWALRQVVAEMLPDEPIALKWPNDLMYRGRKLAGLLCERVLRADLIGVGLNANVSPDEPPVELRRRITSLSQVSRRQFDKTDVLISMIRRLHDVLSRRDEYPFGSILREYDRYHCLRGRRVSVWINRDVRPIRGTCQGLDAMGRLLLKQRSRRLRIVAGHVQVRQTR